MKIFLSLAPSHMKNQLRWDYKPRTMSRCVLCRVIPVIILLMLSQQLMGQKALQFERRGSFSTTRYYVGDELIYKLHSDPRQWLIEEIRALHIEEGFVEFSHRMVHIDSIHAIREMAGRGARPVSQALKGFGISWTFWTAVSFLYRDAPEWGVVAIGPASYGVGQLLKLAFFKTHRMGARKRLRLIDLTF